jgi:membrane protein YqaA with SNARE-associated domain
VKAALVALYAMAVRLDGFGLLIVGIFDSSFLFFPLGNDLLLLGLAANRPTRFPYYALMATAGSLLGCLLLDLVCRKGGEEGLHRWLSKKRLDYVTKRVKKNAGWALALASIMPPPFPFTPFVAGAAAFQYPRKKMFSILFGARLFRFSVVGLLGIYFDKQILHIASLPAVEYSLEGFVVLCVVGSVLSVYGWIKRSKRAGGPPEKSENLPLGGSQGPHRRLA